MPSRVHLLGIPLDPVTADEAISCIQDLLEEGQHHIMTPNSEMLVAAKKDVEFHSILNTTSLNIPDSIGLVWMARLMGQKLPERVTGVDTVTRLCSQLDERHPVFLLGGGSGVGRGASEVLLARNPDLRIAGTFAGSPRDEDSEAIIAIINKAEPHLLLVAYGSPAQDKWIAKHIKSMPSVRVAMGVGGTFDFLAGNTKRAPVLFQKLGLEWLWRLVLQPSRIGRIFTAVVVFPFMVIRSKF
ncbi:MAG: WecB/TagA/CpsF family glycosyltransferase [bacterium]|nr:WecB/TagA/CpsF family glycosyltransferase [bacterium]